MSHKQITYTSGDEISHQDTMNSWFNFNTINGNDIQKEFDKAQELLNHLDQIRATFGMKILIKRGCK